jgi:hypothetical protein
MLEAEGGPDGEGLLRKLDSDRRGGVNSPPEGSLVRLEALAQVLAANVARHSGSSLGPRTMKKGGS